MNTATYPGDGEQNLVLTYDAAGNVTRRLYTGGPDLQFGYDLGNRLLTANGIALTRDAEGRITATSDGDTSFGATYDDAGRLKTAAYNNGAFAVTYTYDVGENGTGLLTGVGDSLTGTQVSFTYDDDRRLKTIGLPNGKTIMQTWDNADRLTRLQSGDYVDLALTYDAGGRITSADLTAPLTPDTFIQTSSIALTCDAAAQINAAGFAYDVRGRMRTAPGQTYTWDGASRLTTIGDVSLAYNGLDSLRTRTGGGATTHYYYNNAIGLSPIVAEKNETTGQFLRYYVWTPGGRLLYLIDAADGNKVYFYHFDQVGSTLALTDAAGAVTDAWAYDPYGRILGRTGTNPQPFTYAGAWGVRQEGAGGTLYHMRARYYDAVIGRFLTPEPIWPQLLEPKSLNPYQYAGADPILFADPTGLDQHNMSHEQRIQYLRSEIERIQQGKPTHFQQREQAEIEASKRQAEKLFADKRAEQERADKARAALEAELKRREDERRALREAPPLPLPQEILDGFEVTKQRAAMEVPLAQKAALGMWHMVLEMMNRRDREREELLGKRETINKIERMKLQKSIDEWDSAIASMMGLIKEELDGLWLR
jgi:RHS repeat-associated protein